MKGFVLAVLAGAACLAGCADNAQRQDNTFADNSYTPLGTVIPRKGPSRNDNVTHVDKQALENDRTMGNGTINLPIK